MAKKVLLSALLALGLLWTQGTANAGSVKTYSNPVAVQLVDIPTSSLKLQGVYELTNKANNQKTLLLPNLTITVTRSGSNVNIDAGSASFASGSGFEVKEVYNVAQYTRFTSTTDLHSGATSDYSVKKTLTKAETAEYINSFVNSKGETWYNVMTADGTKGWVSASSTFVDKNTISVPTVSYGKNAYRGSMSLLPKTSGNVAVINNLDLEDYLKGVVPNEMPASWHKEALKAQAIVARSYAANSMSLKNTTSSQVYRGYTSEDSRSTAAVNETAGVLVKYNGKPIQTFFFSTSGGRTANVGDVWNSNQASYPYLVTVEDPYETSPHSNWEYSFNSATMLESFGFDPATTALYDIKAKATGANGEVTAVTVMTSNGEKTVEGNEQVIRKLFPIEGSYGILKSNWFTLQVNKSYAVRTASGDQSQLSVKGQKVMTGNGVTTTVSGDQVSVQTASGVVGKDADPASITTTGKGWGHRIGMSQYGAKGLAEHNWKAIDIVKHYFPNTEVSK